MLNDGGKKGLYEVTPLVPTEFDVGSPKTCWMPTEKAKNEEEETNR